MNDFKLGLHEAVMDGKGKGHPKKSTNAQRRCRGIALLFL